MKYFLVCSILLSLLVGTNSVQLVGKVTGIKLGQANSPFRISLAREVVYGAVVNGAEGELGRTWDDCPSIVVPSLLGSHVLHVGGLLSDALVFESLRIETIGMWEMEVVAMVQQTIADGNFGGKGVVAIDIGGHVGSYGIGMAAEVGDDGLVLALEPQEPLAKFYASNALRNGFGGRVAVVLAGGGNGTSATIPPVAYCSRNSLTTNEHGLPEGSCNFGAVGLDRQLGCPISVVGGEPARTVPIVRVDDWRLWEPLDRSGIGHYQTTNGKPVSCPESDANCCPTFMKIDAEGLDFAVLRTSLTTIKLCRPFIVFEINHDDESNRAIQFLESLHYEIFYVLAIYAHTPKHSFLNGTQVMGNGLAIPRDDSSLEFKWQSLTQSPPEQARRAARFISTRNARIDLGSGPNSRPWHRFLLPIHSVQDYLTSSSTTWPILWSPIRGHSLGIFAALRLENPDDVLRSSFPPVGGTQYSRFTYRR